MNPKVSHKKENLIKALNTLERAISDDDGSEYLRDAIIKGLNINLN